MAVSLVGGGVPSPPQRPTLPPCSPPPRAQWPPPSPCTADSLPYPVTLFLDPGVLTHQDRGSGGILPHPGEIHGGGRAPHPGGHGAARPHPSPSPPNQGSAVSGGGGGAGACARCWLLPRRLESTSLVVSPMLQTYVSAVSDVLEVCCNFFIWMLQK